MIRFQITHLILVLFFATACSQYKYDLPPDQQSFAQEVIFSNKADIVLVIDNSSSMDVYQNKLSNEAAAMIDQLNSVGMDYHIAVITTDMSSFGTGGVFVGAPKFLTKSTANLKSVLTQRIKQGSTGNSQEQGINSLMKVLSSNYLNGEGRDFLRADALLAVIVLSNEDDHSTNGVGGSPVLTQPVKDYIDKLKPPFGKANARSWILNFIGVTEKDSICQTSPDGIYKEQGDKWLDLAKYSTGTISSICETSLASSIQNVQKRIVNFLTDFYMDREPVVESIIVRLNGVVVPKNATNGWDYLPSEKKIRFYGSYIPRASDRLTVDFTPKAAK